jgi:tripartite-type tricarboxylate transporter receptor subunit TctC
MDGVVRMFWILAIAAGVAAGAGTAAFAQAWPQRSVRIIVPNPAGVAMDVIARLYAERLSVRWGHGVVVENIPGLDGIAGAKEFASRRDDHTLLYSFATLITINPLVHGKLPYDPARDLVPIAATSDNALVIASAASLPVSSLTELGQAARAQAGKLTFAATPGLPRYGFAAFQQRIGADMSEAAYRDFNQAIVDLGEGRIHAVAAGLAPLLPHARAGKVKLLALLNRERVSIAADVPTVAEAGYPELTVAAVTGFFGWRDMPAALRDRIAADIADVGAAEEIRNRLDRIGITTRVSTPEGFEQLIAEQRDRISTIARSAAPLR